MILPSKFRRIFLPVLLAPIAAFAHQWSLLEQVCEENNRCQGGNCAPAESQKAK